MERRTNFKHISKPRTEFFCAICKNLGLSNVSHGFKDCPSLNKLKDVQETERKKAKEEKITAIGTIVAEQVNDVLVGKLNSIEKSNKDILKKLDETRTLMKKFSKDPEMEIVEEDDPLTIHDWCVSTLKEVKGMKKRSKSKIREKLWNEKLEQENDKWETLFHIARMLIENDKKDCEKLVFTMDTTLNEAIDAVCEALV